jgi:light-regulated signal transduction histidine kinase (bacteriophytochrome)
VSARRQGADWRFTVSDNGIGIDAEYAERIFVIFQRLHTKELYAGTGIGLSLCRKIVEHHGGRIWLDTDAPTGTAFHFTLPAIQETA